MLLCYVLYVFRMFYGASQLRSPVIVLWRRGKSMYLCDVFDDR